MNVPRGWLRAQLGGEPAQLQLADLEVGARLEADAEACRREPRISAQVSSTPASSGDPRLQRHQDLALDDLGLAARPEEGDVQLVRR